MEESQDFKPDRGNPAVRHYRGASENVTLVEMCSHLATERAGMGTLHLTVGASELYPNLNGNGEVTDRPDLRRSGASLRPYREADGGQRESNLARLLRPDYTGSVPSRHRDWHRDPSAD